jgi:predicted DNA-binding transcriptional regulator
MEHISELSTSLNEHFGWNKARMNCFVKMLLALMVRRTVNLTQLALHFTGDAELTSRYRRLQRFFMQFQFNYANVAGFIFRVFFNKNSDYYLSMDRTNWEWGKANINILTLAIVYKGTAIPIYWHLLDKKGNSNTAERIAIVKAFIEQFGSANIKGLLCDREFIGKSWFGWLLTQGIPFYIRIKNNTLTTNSKGLAVDIDGLFYGLKPGEQRILKGKRKIWGHSLYLAGLRLDDGKLLIVATDQQPKDAITNYGLRWEIETLFGCLKGRGFNFEDTHIVCQRKIKKMMALLSIAFAWAHKTGEWKNQGKPIKIKTHGRLAMSIFRYGLEHLCQAILKVFYRPESFKSCLKHINIPIEPGLERYS